MFQYASIFEKGRRILPRSHEPKGKTEDSHSGRSYDCKRANLKEEFCQLMLRKKGRGWEHEWRDRETNYKNRDSGHIGYMSLIYEYKGENTARTQDTSLAGDSLGDRIQIIPFSKVLFNELQEMVPRPGNKIPAFHRS